MKLNMKVEFDFQKNIILHGAYLSYFSESTFPAVLSSITLPT